MTFDKVKKLLVDAVDCAEEEVKPEASLTDDLGIDSLDFVELSMEIESEFGITIEDGELAEVKTVQDIVNFVDNKLA